MLLGISRLVIQENLEISILETKLKCLLGGGGGLRVDGEPF